MADILGSVSSALGLAGTSGLQKLTIYGFEDINRDDKATLKSNSNATKFEAFINPDEFTISYSTLYDHTVPIGRESVPGTFLASTPMELQLKFFIDGTLPKRDDQYVTKKIQEFYTACGYAPDRHRPKFIRIIWGSLTLMRFNPDIFDGCLKNVSIQYKLFNQEGLPLRALLTATFVESIPPKKEDAQKTPSSADLTHVRTVKEGDTLPSMTLEIYGDFKYYLEVAKVNGLQNFRDLVPGQKLFFPPLDKNVKTKK
jgi:hypothetical protein